MSPMVLPFLGGKASCPEVTHHILQAKAKVVKYFAMLDAIILKISMNGSNLCFAGFHSFGFLLPQSFGNTVELIKLIFSLS
jgi:hypothetical protein